MKFPFKLTALAVALGISGVASAQSFSTTNLNVIAFDSTTNNYFDAVLPQAIVTSSAGEFSAVVALSSFSAWASYVSAEGTSLSNTNFMVLAGTGGKSAAGDIGFASTVTLPPAVTALISLFTTTIGAITPAPAATTGSFASASAGITNILALNAALNSTLNAPSGGVIDLAYYSGTGGVGTGALETIAVNASAGTLTFAPVTAVPEPGTFAMMGAGLLAVGAMVRRRTRG